MKKLQDMTEKEFESFLKTLKLFPIEIEESWKFYHQIKLQKEREENK